MAKRIIPCLDVKNGRVVKGIGFSDMKDAGDPVEAAAKYNAAGADELVLLDIAASLEGRRTMVDVVKAAASEVSIPLTVGGGISSLEGIDTLFNAGADKVSLNSAAVKDPRLIYEAAKRYGSQRVVVAVDAKRKPGEGGWEVFTHGGQRGTGIDVQEWCKAVYELGAGEILLTSIDADGSKDGYDIALTSRVASLVSIPVIASGGAGKKEDFYYVLTEGGADAALAASLFHYGELSIKELKEYLKSKGI